MLNINININDKKFLYTLEEYRHKYKGKKSKKCECCGKKYRLPGYIFSPRDRICAECESKLDYIQHMRGIIGSIA